MFPHQLNIVASVWRWPEGRILRWKVTKLGRLAGDETIIEGTFQMVATGTEAARTLRAHQAQLLLAAGNPDAEAWRPLNV